jgi:hypothetical protein
LSSGTNYDEKLSGKINADEEITFKVEGATNTYNIVLCNSYPFSLSEPYQSLRNDSDNGTFTAIAKRDWTVLHLFNSGSVITVTLDYDSIISTIPTIQSTIQEISEEIYGTEINSFKTASSGQNSDFPLGFTIKAGEEITFKIEGATNTYNVVLMNVPEYQ